MASLDFKLSGQVVIRALLTFERPKGRHPRVEQTAKRMRADAATLRVAFPLREGLKPDPVRRIVMKQWSGRV